MSKGKNRPDSSSSSQADESRNEQDYTRLSHDELKDKDVPDSSVASRPKESPSEPDYSKSSSDDLKGNMATEKEPEQLVNLTIKERTLRYRQKRIIFWVVIALPILSLVYVSQVAMEKSESNFVHALFITSTLGPSFGILSYLISKLFSEGNRRNPSGPL